MPERGESCAGMAAGRIWVRALRDERSEVGGALVNLKTAARRLGVHYQTAYRWVRSGQLVAVKVGAGYEISDAALERFRAQRAATERVPDQVQAPVPSTPEDRRGALDLLDEMCEQVTTDERAVLQRAVAVTAAVLGDAVTAYLPGPLGLEPVAFDHTDANRAVVLGAMMRGGVTDAPTFSSRPVTDEPVLVPQVAQRDVRTGIRAEFHQFLSTLGFYSAVSAPVVLRDGHRGAVFAARDTPGRPYTLEDLAFVEEVVQRVALAVERAVRGRAAWAARAELLRAICERVRDGDVDGGDCVLVTVVGDEAAVVVDPEGRVQAASKAFATLLESTTADLQRADLSRLFADGAKVRAMLDRLLGGELDYCSIVAAVPRATRRIELHGAIACLPDATPARVLFVAHERPERSA